MVRAPFFDKNGVKKGAWSPEEDERLRSYIEKYGHWNWRELPKFAGLQRCGKSCRLRWMNYLRPEVRHGNYSKEEDELILRLHEEHGNRWSLIASKLPGRTNNEIKNHWNTNLKKRAAESRKAHSGESFQSDAAGLYESEVESSVLAELTPPHLILESSPLSPTTTSTSEFSESLNYDHGSVMGMPSSSEFYEGSINGDFWTEPFVADNLYNNFGYQSPAYSLRTESQVPYDLLYDDTVDLFYQAMQDFPQS